MDVAPLDECFVETVLDSTGGEIRAVADLDADGLQDVLWTERRDMDWALVRSLQEPSGQFGMPEEVATLTGSSRFHAGDFDGDGDIDLLAPVGEQWHLLNNEGEGGWVDDGVIEDAILGAGGEALAGANIDAGLALAQVANLDGGSSDELLLTAGGIQVVWGLGTPELRVEDLDVDFDGTGTLHIANFNGGDTKDILVNDGGDWLWVQPDDAGRYRMQTTPDFGFDVLGDFSGDGATDVLYRGHVHLSTRDGLFVDAEGAQPETRYGSRYWVTDGNGDGLDDLIGVSARDDNGGRRGAVSVLQSVGDGVFATPENYLVNGGDIAIEWAGDVDGDGVGDLLGRAGDGRLIKAPGACLIGSPGDSM